MFTRNDCTCKPFAFVVWLVKLKIAMIDLIHSIIHFILEKKQTKLFPSSAAAVLGVGVGTVVLASSSMVGNSIWTGHCAMCDLLWNEWPMNEMTMLYLATYHRTLDFSDNHSSTKDLKEFVTKRGEFFLFHGRPWGGLQYRIMDGTFWYADLWNQLKKWKEHYKKGD